VTDPTPVPRGGLCQQAADKTPWLDPPQTRHTRNKVKACQGCPVLDACRVYAAEHQWHPGVVVAGWVPATRVGGVFVGVEPVYPPWREVPHGH
jgi:Transcription factor WhiB